ncbi:MAG: cytochrome c biogenesis protein CcsA [Wenzhouxiangellaceae bacterium]|nr:cytochrome c biogenesis protein CcsA [Wenzhouxiangellaceae bacterium]
MLQPIIVIIYLAAAGLIAWGIYKDRPSGRRLGLTLSIVGTLLHAASFVFEISRIGGFPADFFSALSLVSATVLIVLLAVMPRYRSFELLMLALPGAGLMVLTRLMIGPEPSVLQTGTPMLDLHVIASLTAYSLLSIAAVTALVIALVHNMLHRRIGGALLEILPPLVSMEQLLFRMISVGWMILTLSLATGLMFVDDLFAQHLGHKTFLSIISWFVFGGLLFGRWRFGWRGMRVVRLTLIGMAILVLAYFGAKAVLELLLHKRWDGG